MSREVRIFFPEFNIRLYDKNSESDFFFLHQNQNIFYSNIGNQNIFLEKNHNHLPPPFKLNGRSVRDVDIIIIKVEINQKFYCDFGSYFLSELFCIFVSRNMLTLPEHMNSPPVFSVLLLLAISLSVLRYTDYHYPFGIFKLFLGFLHEFGKKGSRDINNVYRFK